MAKGKIRPERFSSPYSRGPIVVKPDKRNETSAEPFPGSAEDGSVAVASPEERGRNGMVRQT